MSDLLTRKEPSVSGRFVADFDQAFADDSDALLNESFVGGETLMAENRRASASPSARKKQSPKGLLLLVALTCLIGVMWLMSGSDSTVPQPVSVAAPVAPLPVVAVQPAPQMPLPAQVEVQGMNDTPSTVSVEKPAVAGSSPQVEQAPVQIEPKPEAPKPISLQPETVKKDAVKKDVMKKSAPAEKSSNKKVSAVKWKANPERFTVQLVAAFSESGVKRIQAQLPQAPPSTIHKTSKEGKPWFVLVYGSYATKQEAANAQAQLPASLKKDLKPWVRKQGEVFGS